jgi:hypothetical protein
MFEKIEKVFFIIKNLNSNYYFGRQKYLFLIEVVFFFIFAAQESKPIITTY